MKYRYKVINADGELVAGTVIADNQRLAIRTLRAQGLNVVDVKEEVSGNQHSGRRGMKAPGTREMLIFMHQLSTLLESGVSLEESVDSLSESAGHSVLAREFGDIAISLRRGLSFPDALKNCGLEIPKYFHPLAQAGELTGKMAQAMRDGTTRWEYELRTANELRNALTYPIILIVCGICSVLLIFALVVPRFVKLLDKTQGEVPLLARVVLGMGGFVNEHLAMIIGAGICAGIFAAYAFIDKGMRQRCRDFLARMPMIGEWLTEANIGQWADMLATLLENRVELLKALDLSRDHVSISSLHARLSHATQSVRNGTSLAVSLRDMGAVTPAGYNLIRVGERSGELPGMLRSLASLYAESGRNRMKRFLIILEPAAILIIGAIVGLIMAGIILAITSANNISL